MGNVALFDNGVVPACEALWVTRQSAKIEVVVDADTMLECMTLKLHAPVVDDGWGVCFRH